MFAAFDEQGRLFVAESAGGDLYDELQKQARRCRVSVLEDGDDDGRFEHARVFAENLVCPMGLAWREQKLYVADPPDLITLEDLDGDGRADRRTVILTGFGHSDNGSLHGLVFGPDGWLYLTLGEPDGYRLRGRDGTLLEGRSGALLRCRPDGSDIELISRGFENLVEVVFLDSGEIIGTDNWFQLPRDGLRDALVHLVEGGRYPYAPDRGTPQVLTGEPLPALALYPAVALSGLARSRSAFSPQSVILFSAQHNSRKIVRHRLKRDGATFRSQDDDLVWTDDPDFHPSDVLEDADGSLLLVDTGSWYVHHCPTGRIRNSHAPGGIYRIHFTDAPTLTDARGRQEDWTNPATGQLAGRLADERPAVRDRAADMLVARGDQAVAALGTMLDVHSELVTKTAAVWVLARINTSAARETLRGMLSDLDAEMIAPAARASGRCADKKAGPQLHALLQHPAQHVQLAAAEALAHCGGPDAVPALADRLASVSDPFLEHALIFALYHLASVKQLEALLERIDPRVQRAALLLLDQPPRSVLAADKVTERVLAADESLRRTAQAILRKHPEWIAQALPALERLLATSAPTPADLESLRSMVVAFHDDPRVAAMAARTITSDSPEKLRVALLEAIAWVAPDRLTPASRGALATALKASSDAVRMQALRTINALQFAGLDEALDALVHDPSPADGLRIGALRALVRRKAVLDSEAFGLLLRQLGRTNDPLGRLAAAEIAGIARLSGQQFTEFVERVEGDPMISPATVLTAAPRTALTAEAADALLAYLRKCVAAGWQISERQIAALEADAPPNRLDQVKALRESSDEAAQRQREQLQALEPLLRGGDAARGRVVFAAKAGCAACHRVAGQGGMVGPDLTKIGAVRAGRDLIESIVMPSATFAQGYETYTVTLPDDATLSGIRIRQPDDSLVLRDSSGIDTRISAGEATNLERQKLSLMPEGLLNALDRSEIRDLLAYLQSLR